MEVKFYASSGTSHYGISKTFTPEQYMLPKLVSTYKKVLQDVVNEDTLQAMKERRRQAYLNLLSK